MAFTREQFDRMKAEGERRGIVILTRWRPGLKTLRLADCVLTPEAESRGAVQPRRGRVG